MRKRIKTDEQPSSSARTHRLSAPVEEAEEEEEEHKVNRKNKLKNNNQQRWGERRDEKTMSMLSATDPKISVRLIIRCEDERNGASLAFSENYGNIPAEQSKVSEEYWVNEPN